MGLGWQLKWYEDLYPKGYRESSWNKMANFFCTNNINKKSRRLCNRATSKIIPLRTSMNVSIPRGLTKNITVPILANESIINPNNHWSKQLTYARARKVHYLRHLHTRSLTWISEQLLQHNRFCCVLNWWFQNAKDCLGLECSDLFRTRFWWKFA